MTTEIMTSVLAKFNRKMEATKRTIMLFMGNAPCHSESISDRFPNVPRNTTSRLQLLNAGIIRNSKAKYRKKIFVISRIDNNVKATMKL